MSEQLKLFIKLDKINIKLYALNRIDIPHFAVSPAFSGANLSLGLVSLLKTLQNLVLTLEGLSNEELIYFSQLGLLLLFWWRVIVEAVAGKLPRTIGLSFQD